MRTFIGLGSNLGSRQAHLRRAVSELKAFLSPARVSSLYETAPAGWAEQDFFLNAVLEGEWHGEALELAQYLWDLERRVGRQAGPRNGPRILDLDLLLLGNQEQPTEKLTLPHPRIKERGFVLYPLWELAPDLRFADETLTSILRGLSSEELVLPRIGPSWATCP